MIFPDICHVQVNLQIVHKPEGKALLLIEDRCDKIKAAVSHIGLFIGRF